MAEEVAALLWDSNARSCSSPKHIPQLCQCQACCQALGDKEGWCLPTERVSKLRRGGGVGLGDFSITWQQLDAVVLGWDVSGSLRMSWEGG